MHLLIEFVDLVELTLKGLHLLIGLDLLLLDLIPQLAVLVSQLLIKLDQLVQVVVLAVLHLPYHLLQ